MDPQVLQMMLLLSQAKRGNKNLSGILGNLDNPIFTAMAGQFDAPSYYGGNGAGGTGGSKWQQYANSDMPVVHDIMDKIQQGVDNRWLSSYVESLPASGVDMAGFQTSDLKGLAGDLYKEYNSGTSGGKKDAFSKAGLRSPADVYNIGDVPLDAQQQAWVRSAHLGVNAARNVATHKNAEWVQAQKEANVSGQQLKDIAGNYIKGAMRSVRQTGTAKEIQDSVKSLKHLGNWVKNQKTISAYELQTMTDRFAPKPSQEVIDYQTGQPRMVENDAYKKTSKDLMDLMARKGLDIKTTEAQKKKIADKANAYKAAQDDVSINQLLGDVTRQGALNAYKAAGRTPFTDQMTQLMRFAAGSK